MTIWKDHRLTIKYSLLTLFGSSIGWFYYQVKHTKHVLEHAIDTSIVKAMDRCAMRDINIPISEETFFEIKPISGHKKDGIIKWIVDSLKFMYVRRLIAVTKDTNKYNRRRALNKLADINLEDWHCSLLANMIDPRTAVALARTTNVDKRLFLEPPFRYHNYNKGELINEMREFLISLFEMSSHSCISYFLSKVFVFEHDSAHIIDHDSSALELSKFIQSEQEILPMCLESILHHCSIEKFSKDIADLNGLPLLMEIYKRYSDNNNVIMQLCQILSHMSLNKELLEPFYKSGWIGVLLDWCSHEDIRISIPAARALANLDEDNMAQYSSNLYILHPLNRTKKCQEIDVIFIHGLLGGVFFTWRQRKKGNAVLGLMGKNGMKKDKETLIPETVDIEPIPKPSKKKKLLQDITDKLITLDEYEVVWDDIPLNANENCTGPFTCPGSKCTDADEEFYTYYWPKDWLAMDCKNIRILGINYDTSLSMWNPLCPLEKEKLTLNERSDLMAEKLLKCDVGKRPIVWVTHSMGGLIVKNILCKAYNSTNENLRNICMNTKGVVFYSTPHNGSKLANLNNAISLVLWPSVEVQELRENSPQLKHIHEQFLKIVKESNMKVITFVETKSTVVSAMKFNFLLVEKNSGNPGVGEYYEIPQDHLGICKPENKFSFLYQKVVHLLKELKTSDEFRK